MSTLPHRVPRRIATLSVHTSPLDQPGTGDAGGLNVYVVEVAKRLAARGTEVEIFTRAVCRDTPPLAELAPGVLVRSVVAGPFEELDKTDLPAHVCQFTLEVLRAEAAAEPGRYDLVHAHYWLSGKVGAAAKERWGVPLVQSMHTLGKVKNEALAAGDTAEPDERIQGEHEVIAAADRLIANTTEEARQLTEFYGADPAKVQTVNPGADLSVFRPGTVRARHAARRRLGVPQDAVVLLFVGRVQPLKGPDIALRTAALLAEADPELRRTLRVVLVGGPSGRQERADPERMRELAAHLGISDLIRFEPPCPQAELAEWYRAATVVLTPSHSESFGLVALEAQACGTPVVAASVGGLRTVVKDGHSGLLVDGHDPADWARVIRRLVRAPRQLAALSAGARRHASVFGWSATVDRLARVYTGAMDEAATSRRGNPPHPPGHSRWESDGIGHPAARIGALPEMAAVGASGGASPGGSLGAVLDALGVRYENPAPGSYLVRLEGQHKLVTMTWLTAGEHSLQVEAFFCRQPDENHAAFYRFLLERGARMYGVHFALDRTGDVYLAGRLPLAAITEPEIDRLLGCVLAYADETFNEALRIGFASAIRREWAWREKRGESLANLRPFAALRPDAADGGEGSPP